MKLSLKLEELAMFATSILIFYVQNFDWWLFPALILIPDISMLGYALNNKIGAYSYNFFHHKAVALITLVCGYYFMEENIILAGIILLGHSSMDRILGYGLKYTDDFKHTHLGWLHGGKVKEHE